MPLYEYRCGSGHVTELIRPVSVTSQRCSCGGVSTRLSVYAFSQVGVERKLPGADFAEASEMLADQHEAVERREGVSVAPPPLYRMAKARAQRMMKQGASSSADVR